MNKKISKLKKELWPLTKSWCKATSEQPPYCTACSAHSCPIIFNAVKEFTEVPIEELFLFRSHADIILKFRAKEKTLKEGEDLLRG